MKQTNWEKEFDEKFSVFDGSQKIIKFVCYSTWIKDFIKEVRQQAILETIEKVEKEVIGEDELNLSRPDAYSNEGESIRLIRNQLRSLLRARLSALKKEGLK